jgi:acyl-CoA hydrolase
MNIASPTTLAYQTPEEAVRLIQSGNRVFVHGSAATPLVLLNALLARAGEVSGVELTAISTYGDITWDRPEVREHFYLNSLFVSPNVREWVASPAGEYIPVFLSEIPKMFETGVLPLDVAIVQVSPPDTHGFCSLGTSVDAAAAAVQYARTVIAQVNPRMPRTLGDGAVHWSRFSAAVLHEAELPEVSYAAKMDEVTAAIGRQVAELIEDGATLQMGIGAIPDAVLSYLGNHKGLGVHTEMFSDGLIPLVQRGVITNEHKRVQRGKTVTSFVLGSRRVYDFVHDNPTVSIKSAGFVNDTSVIRRNPKVVAINSCIEIDLTGQVCSDSIGTYQFSGIGGQMDFMRGASLSEGGKPSSRYRLLQAKTSRALCRCLRRAPVW